MSADSANNDVMTFIMFVILFVLESARPNAEGQPPLAVKRPAVGWTELLDTRIIERLAMTIEGFRMAKRIATGKVRPPRNEKQIIAYLVETKRLYAALHLDRARAAQARQHGRK